MIVPSGVLSPCKRHGYPGEPHTACSIEDVSAAPFVTTTRLSRLKTPRSTQTLSSSSTSLPFPETSISQHPLRAAPDWRGHTRHRFASFRIRHRCHDAVCRIMLQRATRGHIHESRSPARERARHAMFRRTSPASRLPCEELFRAEPHPTSDPDTLVASEHPPGLGTPWFSSTGPGSEHHGLREKNRDNPEPGAFHRLGSEFHGAAVTLDDATVTERGLFGPVSSVRLDGLTNFTGSADSVARDPAYPPANRSPCRYLRPGSSRTHEIGRAHV